MGKIAFAFPGQGSQSVGMGRDFYDNFQDSKDIFELGNELIGKKITNIIFNGNEEDLKSTDIAQPAIYLVSMAIFSILKQNKINPDYVSGHSLGEYSAITASGLFDISLGLELVKKRGSFLRKACDNNIGGMCAVIGLEAKIVEDLVNELKPELGNEYIGIANYNSNGQVVLSFSGNDDVFEKINKKFTEAKAKMVVRLNVSGPFHSPLMESASNLMRKELENVEFANQNVPVIFNYNADIKNDKTSIKEIMALQITHPVRWIESVNRMVEYGVDTIVEIGPGKVLTGLNKRINKSLNVYNINNIDSMNKFLQKVS